MSLTKEDVSNIFYFELFPLLGVFILTLIWAVNTKNGLFDFYRAGYDNNELLYNNTEVYCLPNHNVFVAIALLLAIYVIFFYILPIIFILWYSDIYDKTNQIIIRVLSYIALSILLISLVVISYINILLAVRSSIAFGALLGIIYIILTKFIN
jgi:hypothetical protein